MDAAEFREAGRDAVEWVARYMEEVEKYPVLSQVRPGEVRRKLPAQPPQEGEPFDALLRDLNDIILPGITHWQSPSFFAYFPANASPPAILGDLISSGLGVQGMLWATSPACTELETHVLDWMVDLLGLPAKFKSDTAGGGVIQDTASSATLSALLAARERATGGKSNEEGVSGTLTAYTSNQAHSSLEKAAGIAGIGRRNMRPIEVDDAFALRPDALEQAIGEDLKRGHTPFFVSATIGTTSSTAIDPVPAIAEICRRYKLWLHVDAAHAGSAAICPELRWIHQGVEHADSYCVNPHKWLLTNFDCDLFYVADRRALISAFSVQPEYLRNQASEAGAVIDYRDWHIPLGRRFRSLKLWFVIRHYGVDGLRGHIRKHVELAREFAEWVTADQRFELAAPVTLNLVCFRLKHGDEANQKLMDDLNRSGKMYLTQTRLKGKLTLRMAIGGTLTERHHVRAGWELISGT